MVNTDRIGIGVVGAGAIAREQHIPGFRAIPGVELVGVVNQTPESTQRAAAELGFRRIYLSWQELIDDHDADAVVVATWPNLHAPVAIAALEAGKHILTQARMAMDSIEAREMLDASLRHPELVAMVAPSPFSLWADRTLNRLITERAVGRIRSVRTFWGGSPDPADRVPWRFQRRFSGNNVMQLGIVYEAMARWLGHAEWVEATTHLFQPKVRMPDGQLLDADVPDYVALTVGFPGSTYATIEMASYADHGESDVVYLYGEDGTLRADFIDDRIELTTPQKKGFRSVPILSEDHGVWRVEEEFIGAIRHEESVSLTDFPTGLNYMSFTDGVHESAREGRRVSIPADS